MRILTNIFTLHEKTSIYKRNFTSNVTYYSTEKLNEDSDNLRDMLETIIRNQNEHSFILKDIRQRITSYYSEGEVDEKNLMGLDFQLPCENLESLVDLEVYVSSHMGQFIKLIEKIGGDDGRDYTYRCLKTLFTNSLGEICSWTGQKSNYAVGHLKLLELVFDVVHRKTNCTKKEFEFYTKEWFRHSKQRREREDKRKEK